MGEREKKRNVSDEVSVMFRTSQRIRGAVKHITAWADMEDIRIQGQVPSDRDIYSWMAALLYTQTPDRRTEMLRTGAEAYAQLTEGQPK